MSTSTLEVEHQAIVETEPMAMVVTPETEAEKALREYTTRNQRLSARWTQYARTALEVFAHQPVEAGDEATQSQIKSMANHAHTLFTEEERYLYGLLREVVGQASDAPDTTGSRPGGLTDQRLIIEICLLTGDYSAVEALIAQYPTVRLANLVRQ